MILLFDNVSWLFIRVYGLFIELAGEVIMSIINPNPVKDYELWQELLSFCASGEMMFKSPSVDSFPDVMRSQLLWLGRTFLIIFSCFVYVLILHGFGVEI